MDPEEMVPVRALKEKTPATVGEVHQMLGFLSYYRPFIPNFSHVAHPLYNLLAVPHPENHTPDQPIESQKENRKEKERSLTIMHTHTVDQLLPRSAKSADRCTHKDPCPWIS